MYMITERTINGNEVLLNIAIEKSDAKEGTHKV